MFNVNKKDWQELIVLQRVELCSDFIKKIRKFPWIGIFFQTL